jgi:hypothetical protein
LRRQQRPRQAPAAIAAQEEQRREEEEDEETGPGRDATSHQLLSLGRLVVGRASL